MSILKVIYILLAIIVLGILGYVAYAYFFRYESIEVPKRTLVEHIVVHRNDEGNYIFEFTRQDTYKIYQGATVDEINWEEPIRETSDTITTFTNYSLTDRYFFGITNSKGRKFIVSERRIPMKGADNFRDLGGIPTADGRFVKWGKFYRSGKLNKLSDRDLLIFSALDIETVVDFRDDIERAKDPSRFPTNYEMKDIRVPIGDTTGEIQTRLKKQIFEADPETWDGREFIQDINRQFIDSFAYQYKPFLHAVTKPENTPVVYHCSAGKDRTGLATALLLSLLGVEREVIMGDFLMSNYYKHESIKRTLFKSALAGIDAEITEPVVTVDESYLAAALEAIEKNFGGMDSLLMKEYDFTAEHIEEIRNNFLTNYDMQVDELTGVDTIKVKKPMVDLKPNEE